MLDRTKDSDTVGDDGYRRIRTDIIFGRLRPDQKLRLEALKDDYGVSISTLREILSRLASEGKMPERFLLQILRNLVTHGILRSTRGVDGGYALVKPANEISLLEVIEAIEGPYDSNLEVGEGLPQDSQNKLRRALEDVTTTTRGQLEAIKLSALLKPPPAR